ncbi:MAG: glycosyltransferase family 4 protein [Kiritimatiellae bacterium]|nr:glycosyltransferase family 4 protein [Kiritimatiellia bacterium]
MSPAISILVPDIGAPSLGAAIRLRELLHPLSTEIVGPDFGTGICSLYTDAGPFTSVPAGNMYRYPDFLWASRRLDRAIRGRLVIAVKAFMNTVPVALRRQRQGGKAVVFLDEWDGALYAGWSPREKQIARLKSLHHPLDDAYFPVVESMISAMDTVLSTTHFLQKKFGGHVVHMGVDTDWFSPQPEDAVDALKRSLGLAGKRLIVFGGVVRPHKGTEQILEALVRLNRDELRLLVVGPVTDYLSDLMNDARYARWLVVAGAPLDDPEGTNRRIHAQMPLYLDLADLVVLPLLDTPLAQSQMPIKLFEALAMGKPVIGSHVSDLPEILDGCGETYPPGDCDRLAMRIGEWLDHPEIAHTLGQAAREKCRHHYSKAAAGQKIQAILTPLLT